LNINELITHVQESFAKLPLDICRKVWTTAQIATNQILLHNGNNDYKLPHVGKLKVERAAGRDIPMRLPCRALIDGRVPDCEYIVTFMANGKLIVVLTALLSSLLSPAPVVVSRCALSLCPLCRCHAQQHRAVAVTVAVIAPSPSPSPLSRRRRCRRCCQPLRPSRRCHCRHCRRPSRRCHH